MKNYSYYFSLLLLLFAATTANAQNIVKSLERDVQVESLLRARRASLGIDARSVRPIGQELAEIAGFGRSRSRGIGIGM